MTSPLKHDHFRRHYVFSRATELVAQYAPSLSRVQADAIAREEFDNFIQLVETHGKKLHRL